MSDVKTSFKETAAQVTRGALTVGALLLAAACSQSPQRPASEAAAPQTVAAASSAATSTPIPALVDQAGQCGRSLGIAVRCNMVNDENDFAILRHLALQGLLDQAPGDPGRSQIETAFDVAALESINAVGACRGADTGLAALEQKIEGTIGRCTRSQP